MKRRFLILAALACAANTFAAQRTFVSASSGDDANPCTRALPCRTFNAALPLTDAGGEIVAVDSGGYGPATITQSVSLVAPGGVYAGITAFSGEAIQIIAANTDAVSIRNLSLTGLGATNGITIAAVGFLDVAGTRAAGFSGAGIFFQPEALASAPPLLTVTRSTISRCNQGVYAGNGRVTLDSLALYGNTVGVQATNTHVVIHGTVSRATSYGYYASGGATMTIADSAGSGGDIGFFSLGGTMYLERCSATDSSRGIEADNAGSAIYVSGSVITNNTLMGLQELGGAIVASRGNNTLAANAADGTFTSTFAAQ